MNSRERQPVGFWEFIVRRRSFKEIRTVAFWAEYSAMAVVLGIAFTGIVYLLSSADPAIRFVFASIVAVTLGLLAQYGVHRAMPRGTVDSEG
ncbi:hypothetical protein ACFVMC_17205 [Nocardia sp. NPDC127579]|uniref:hypothetical protein n=1 Tax=Nocardia sp. NPDC127579 TaxID=3345402 RepID=UPI003643AA44